MQTKKRAKPVKFGKAAKEAEEKKIQQAAPVEEPQSVAEPEPVEEEAAEQAPAHEAHVAHEAPTISHGGELVDKLSDVPFETDFGTPSGQAEQHHAPKHESEPEPVAPEPEPEPAAPQHAPEQATFDSPAAPDTSTSPQLDVSPVPPTAPIGRANEPIPFNPHETVFNTPPDAGEKKKNPFLYFIIIAVVAFVTGLAFMAGIYYAMPNKNLFAMPSLSMPGLPAAQPTATPTPAITAPTPTTAKAVPISDLSVKVLNGSGVRGEAAKVKTTLEAQGFKVATVGNAESSDVVKTQISVKKSVDKAAITKLTDTLKKTYVLDKVTELPATATSEPDITVTIGKETAN